MSIQTKWLKEDILALNLVYNIPYRYQKFVLQKYSSLDNFLSNPPEWFSNKSTPIWTQNKSHPELDWYLERLTKEKINFITIFDEDYPINLKNIDYPPIILYYKGKLSNNYDCISIVGTRKNTLYGKIVTEKIVAELVKNNIIVVSGLAYGIDSISHRETLKNNGITYAVVASGIDEISPSIARELANKIVDAGGAIISEYPPGVKARPGYFPQRNRIISGIARAVVVIESDIKGGSLITARFAVDQNRDVFAVPGPINSNKSAGCNKLIHDNLAIPVTSPESILFDLGIIDKIDFAVKNNEIQFDDDLQKIIFEEISSEPLHIDDLSEKINVDISILLVKLLELEFKGLARQLPGKYFVKN